MKAARVNPRPGIYRKYGSLRVLLDGRVRFSPWTLPGLHKLSFTVVYARNDPPGSYSVHAEWRNDVIFLLYVTRHRVETACFAYHLSEDGLRDAVSVIRAAGGGLERWIIPALEWCQDAFARMSSPKPNQIAMRAIIPDLLKSVRRLPVASQWKKLRQEAERRERGNAGAPNGRKRTARRRRGT